jgi:phosphomethylpyrimidine synthase
MTQLEYAKRKIISPLMKKVAKIEGLSPQLLCRGIREGTIVIPHNKNHRIAKPCGVGKGLRTKVNANIGTSTDKASVHEELHKLNIAVACGADTIMDLSVGGNICAIRKAILRKSAVPVGTVPIYEIAVQAQRRGKDPLSFSGLDVLETIRQQAEEGVDFFTIHAGVTRKSLQAIQKRTRILDIVSRGGALLAAWIVRNKKENPFFEYYDKILDIAHQYDVTISLGDGLRPGSILDATDKAQLTELKILGILAKQAKRKNVQVMIEGPGHVPLHQIKENVKLEKEICGGAPFYVLGPLVTDIAAGYDHITAAIGGALAASYGADFLCYVTPAEHLRHPTPVDVKEGVIASRIAAHAADIAKDIKQTIDWDKRLSLARKARDWKRQIVLSIDPQRARKYRNSSRPGWSDVCTMCGKYCSIRLMEQCLS